MKESPERITETPLIVRLIRKPFEEFVRAEASGGILLFAAALAAIVWANSSVADSYHHLWERELTIGLAPLALTLSLHAWINDALMAVFFLLVGLEIKREILVGELASVRGAALPIVGALGGMVAPALLFWSITRGTSASAGWGIPMATDIAFALGVATLLGSYVPPGLKIFLAALAIVDDIGAVLVIALFYTAKINMMALGVAAVLLVALTLLNKLHVQRAWPYIIVGILLWLAVLNSGLHATIAGVLLAFTIPASLPRAKKAQHEAQELARNANTGSDDGANADGNDALLARMEHALHGVVGYGIMPLFALANAGVGIQGEFGVLVQKPVVLAVVAGLVVGKTVGITLLSWLAVRLNIAQLPANSTWRQVAGVAALAGIGFTMSLFIGALAYGEGVELTEAKIGVLGGSLIAGLLGVFVLRSGKKPSANVESTTTP